MTKAINTNSTPTSTGFLRLPQVLRLIPIGRSSWWAGVKSGRYPASIKLGPKTTVWKADEIYDFIESIGKEEQL